MRTLIKASWIVGHEAGSHRLVRDGVVVYEGNTIIHVGKSFDGPVDKTIDAAGKLVAPGFIDTHSHLHSSPIDKSVQEDYGPRQFWLTGLIEILPAEDAGLTRAGMESCVDYSLIELARSGTTTVLHLGDAADYVADQVDRIGMRGYVAPSYRSGRWFTPDGKRVDYEWDLAAGHEGLQRAIAFIEACGPSRSTTLSAASSSSRRRRSADRCCSVRCVVSMSSPHPC